MNDRELQTRFVELHQQYSRETHYLSFVKEDHPSFVELQAMGVEAVPIALARLQDTIGYDRDIDNDPWVLIRLLGYYQEACLKGFPEERAGRLNELRDWILRWARVKEISF